MKHSLLFLLTLSFSLSMVCLSGSRVYSQNIPPFKARWVDKPFPPAIFTDADHRVISRDVIIGVDLDKDRRPRSYEKIRAAIDHLMQ